MATPGGRSRFGDIFGNLRRTVPPTETVGDPGVGIFGGFVESEEKNQDLLGFNRYVTFSDILANTTIVAAGIRYYMNLVSKAQWTVIPSDPNNARADQVAQNLQRDMEKMRRPWHRIIKRASGYRLYGFSVQEMTAKIRPDGWIGMLDIMPRPQSTIEKWDLSDDASILGIVQRSKQDGREIYIPREKAVYLVDDALHDSPEGLGLFRHIVETNERLKRYQDLEGFGFETDLRGVPIGRAPLSDLMKQVRDEQLTEAQAISLLAPLRKFLRKYVKTTRLSMLLDSRPWFGQGETQSASSTRQFDLELLKAGNTSASAINVTIDRLQREIARVLGVEFLLLGNAGSQALSRDKSHNFGLLVESALDEIRETMENDYVPFTMKLNGIPEEDWPTLKTETVQYRDVETITEGLERLARAALHPTDPAIDEVREVLGLSPQPEDVVNLLLEEANSRTGLVDGQGEPPDDLEDGDSQMP